MAESGPAVHVAPAGVFQIGGITITNSILYGWICTLAIVAHYNSSDPCMTRG